MNVQKEKGWNNVITYSSKCFIHSFISSLVLEIASTENLIHIRTLKKLSGHFCNFECSHFCSHCESPSYAYSEPSETSIEHHVSMPGLVVM